ncbi:hypothetical protein CRG98_027429 [Punica granatum]|uniref:Uncharacterized protein n=1 Tax=Punica granatum TaxID=22663 RepID=A0A2I0J913_PUNGR|nr:hypothetical protein CRG98_027429 [Punica granatum]
MVAEETLLHDHQSLPLGQEHALALRLGVGMKTGMLSPGWPDCIRVRVLEVGLEIWMLCMAVHHPYRTVVARLDLDHSSPIEPILSLDE